MKFKQTHFLQIIRAHLAVAVLVLCSALGVGHIRPAFASVEDIMRATEGGDKVRVIIKLRQARDTLRREARVSTFEQKRAVADAMNNVEPALREMGIAIDTRFATLPFAGVTVDRAHMLKLLERTEVESVFLNVVERKVQAVAVVRERVSLASSVPSIDVVDAWAKGFDGANTVVAVIDGGFRTSHPMQLPPNVRTARQ